jgi:multidrug efflux pump subunit AcrA (membrane-fusion protein)
VADRPSVKRDRHHGCAEKAIKVGERHIGTAGGSGGSAGRPRQSTKYTGRITQAETVEVRPRVSGFIESIHFKDGEIIK